MRVILDERKLRYASQDKMLNGQTALCDFHFHLKILTTIYIE